MNYSFLQWAILLAVFIPSTILDIKEKQICAWLVVCVGIAGIINTSCTDMPSFFQWLVRIIPGLALLMTAYLTKGCVGYGDGLIGLFLGVTIIPGLAVAALFYGFLLSALFGLVMIVTKKASRKTKLPFVPFYFMGVIICGFA